MISYFHDLKEEVDSKHVFLPNEIIPCSERDVQVIERELNLAIPQAYKEFLLWMGKKAGDILLGSDWLFDDLPKIQKWAIELMQANGVSNMLPSDAFVIYMHQGYQFSFVRISEGDDPPVYYYDEMRPYSDFPMLYARFSDYLNMLVRNTMMKRLIH